MTWRVISHLAKVLIPWWWYHGKWYMNLTVEKPPRMNLKVSTRRVHGAYVLCKEENFLATTDTWWTCRVQVHDFLTDAGTPAAVTRHCTLVRCVINPSSEYEHHDYTISFPNLIWNIREISSMVQLEKYREQKWISILKIGRIGPRNHTICGHTETFWISSCPQFGHF